MGMDLATAKRAAQQVGATPPQEWQGNEDAWYQQWFKDGIDAGDPRLLKAAGLYQGQEGGDENAQGYNKDFMNAAPSSEWMGKRNPSPSELRRFAKESNQSEDYARFSDAQLSAWIKKGWKGDHFENDYGDRVEKPSEDGPNSAGRQALFNTGKYGNDPNAVQGGGGGGGGGGGYGAPPPPPQPTTVGTQLSMTGNPMQDMLIQQFNTGQNTTYGQGNNVFGLGEDRAVGGTGANADIDQATGGQQTATAQSLRGGGLWYGQDKATFGGWDATKDQALAGTKQTRDQQQDVQAYNKGKAKIAAPAWQQPAQPATAAPVVNQDALTRSATGSLQDRRKNLGGMLYNRYQGNPQGGGYF